MGAQFQIVLESESDNEAAELRALRFALKRLGRNYHFRCKTIRPVEPSVPAEVSPVVIRPVEPSVPAEVSPVVIRSGLAEVGSP